MPAGIGYVGVPQISPPQINPTVPKGANSTKTPLVEANDTSPSGSAYSQNDNFSSTGQRVDVLV